MTIGGLNSKPSPNLGGVNVVGGAGLVAIAPDDSVNFDISPSGTGFLSARSTVLSVPTLYTVNLATGAVAGIARTPTTLSGLAVVPASTVQFGAATFTQGEAGGSATISVTRGGSLTRTTRATYAAADGSASGTLVFAPGETTKTFSVPIANDAADNPDRAVTLTLTAGDALTTAGGPATLTVIDDDARRRPRRPTPRRRP